MLQVCTKDTFLIVLNSDIRNENLEKLNTYIQNSNSQYMTVDISSMNIIDASAVASLGSTMHYIKYPEGAISWIVNSTKVKEYTTSMNLGNSKFICKK